MLREKTDAEKLLEQTYNYNSPFLELLLEENGLEPVEMNEDDKHYIVCTPWDGKIDVNIWLREKDYKNEGSLGDKLLSFEGLNNPKDEYSRKKFLILIFKTGYEADMLTSEIYVNPYKNKDSFEKFVKVRADFSNKLNNEKIQDFIYNSGFPIGDDTYLVINPSDMGDLILKRDPCHPSKANILRLETELLSLGVVLTRNIMKGKGFLVNLNGVKIKSGEVKFTQDDEGYTMLETRLLHLVDSGQLVGISISDNKKE